MISKELKAIFQKSLDLARSNLHEYLTIEHIFAILIRDDGVKALLTALGVSIEELHSQLSYYFEHYISSIEPKQGYVPIETSALNRVVDNMMQHVYSSSKKEANLDDMIVAIYDEHSSYSSQLLASYGVERVEILEAISHGEFITPKEDIKTNPQDKKSALEQFCTDLSAQARKGKIDPVIGREDEIQKVQQTLCRRKKNNPILVGEPGVGKTALVEGFAINVHNGEVPDVLKNSQVYALDLGSLISGTKYRGEFEKRLKSIIDEISVLKNVILFIDEIHMLVGAGATGGSMDASNLLKPALSSGAIKCIGATTYSEYRNHFDKDKALSRRFNKIDVEEPSVEDTINILTGLKKYYEEHHKITYTDEAIKKAVELSKRYMIDKFLPDSAIDVIDEVGASFTLSKDEKTVVDVADIEKVVSGLANIPLTSLKSDELENLANLDAELSKRVYGQDEAIASLTKIIKRNKAGLGNANHPIGTFLFSGPTGVGKTELANTLANTLGINFLRFDMSEYMEKHTVSKLIGAPAGYVGFDEGGLLTEAIRKNPHTLLLLDEIEKANADVLNVLLQVMDNGTLTDSSGLKADFRNCIIIMTSNLGAKETNQVGFTKSENFSTNRAIKNFFTPEFVNRIDKIINFNTLSNENVIKIIDKNINDLNETLKDKNITVELTQEAKEYILKEGYSSEYGAREIERYIDDHIKTPLTDEVLFGKLKDGGEAKVDFIDGELSFNYSSK